MSQPTTTITAAGNRQAASIHRLRGPATWMASICLAAALAGFFLDRNEFWRAYLVAWIFCVEIGLGGLGLVLLHHLVRSRWNSSVQPIARSAALTLPVLGLAFLPLLLALPHLYPWADQSQMAASELLRAKSAWLNLPFFAGRTLVYFGIWSVLAYRLHRSATQKKEDGRSDRGLGALGMIVYLFTTTFAAFDWMMSLEPTWFSSIYGLLFLAGQAVAGITLAIMGLALTPAPDRVHAGKGSGSLVGDRLENDDLVQSFNDLGNLLLAAVMIWAYFAFSQYLIIWSSNIPEEAVWYVHRSGGGWQWVVFGLLGLHFVLPFSLLLSRRVKRNRHVLLWLAGLLFCARALDLYWLIIPSFSADEIHFHWLYPLLLVGMCSGWAVLFASHLARASRGAIPDDQL